jgi:SAM-dependent methyltransferase
MLAGSTVQMSWVDYWNKDTSIYVNARHKAVHYERIAADLAPYLAGSPKVVLDYGCGEALCAGRIADQARKVYLYDAAERVRSLLLRRYAADPKIEVLDAAGLAALPAGTLDLVLVNSVLQYLSAVERDRLLALCREKLAPGGVLLLGDVIPPHIGIRADTTALLSFAAANGFLGAALAGLVRTLFSDYRRTRAALGLARYSFGELAQVLARAGFSAERAPRNIGHNQARMTIVCRVDRA